MNKNNNKLWRLVGAAIVSAGMLVTVSYGYGRYCQRVDMLENTTIKADKNERAIIAIMKDLEHLKKGQDEIKEKLDDN